MTYYERKSARIPGFDYSSVHYYFITICADHHRCIFGSVNQLNTFGNIAKEDILQLEKHFDNIRIDKFVVMPNHVHMIVVIDHWKENVDIPTLVSLYKAGVTRKIRIHQPNMTVWQRSFHDHVIRDQRSYEKIWNYIENNPLKWEEDCFYRGI